MSDHLTKHITGGTRRPGKAIARHYAQLGWRLVLCYAGDRDAAEITRSALLASAESVRVVQCDTGVADRVEAMLDSVERIPIPRWGTVEDLCQAWDYLLAATYATGVNIDVAGGFRL